HFQFGAPFDVKLELLRELPFHTIPLEYRSEPECHLMEPTPLRHDLCLAESNDLRNRAGQPFPVGGLAVQCPAAGACERIELGTPAVFRYLPLRFDPAFLFELVERGIKGPIANLEDFSRNLFQALADRPGV